MTNAALAVEFCNKSLVEASSKLGIEYVCKTQDSVSMSTNSVTLAAELEVIKQQLKKTASLSETTEIESYLPQSKSFLKVLDISYQNSNTSLPITLAQVGAALFSFPLFENITLVFLSCIIKVSPSSNISVIWIDI